MFIIRLSGKSLDGAYKKAHDSEEIFDGTWKKLRGRRSHNLHTEQKAKDWNWIMYFMSFSFHSIARWRGRSSPVFGL